MTIFADRVKVSTPTSGTGTILLGSPAAGYQSFDSGGITNGGSVRYVIEDGTAWEIGTGVYNSGALTMTRSLLSSSTGSLIELSGSAVVFIALTAVDITASIGTGDVTGPASAIADNVALFDGVTGKLIKDSGSALPTQYTDEMAQDAVGGMVNTSLTYVDATPSLALTARTIGGVSYDGTANITVATATGGFTVSGGNLALGTNSLTLTGSIGATGARATKVWATDVESTNMYTVGGTSLSSTFQPLDADLTTIAGLTATTDNFIVSVASAWASRTPAQVKTTLSLNNVDNTADASKIVASAAILTTARNFSLSGGGITSATVSFDGSAPVVLVPVCGDLTPTSVRIGGAASTTTIGILSATVPASATTMFDANETAAAVTGASRTYYNCAVSITGTLGMNGVTGMNFTPDWGSSGTLVAQRGCGGIVRNTGTGTVTLCESFSARIRSTNASGIITHGVHYNIVAPTSAGGTALLTGLNIPSLKVSGVTKAYAINSQGTTDLNVFAGSTRIGGTSDPTVPLDVTGAALFSSTVGITGALSLTVALTPANGGTGITALGTGVATALGVNVGSAGAFVTFNGALGTPSSGTLTNCTGLPTAGLVDDAVTYAKIQNVSATSRIMGRITAAAGDMEELTAANVKTILALAQADITGLTTASSPEFAAVNIGAATDTTITRTGAGDIAVEGNAIYRAGGTDVPVADGGTGSSTAAGARTNLGVDVVSINFVIDGGGATITTGVKGDLVVDFACTIVSATLLADQSGSIVVNIWKDTYANYPPVVGDKITASAPPTISSATKSQDSTLTGWTTSISAGDTLRFNVDSITTCQRVTLSLKVTRA